MELRTAAIAIVVIIILAALGPVLAADFIEGIAEWFGTFIRELGD